MGRSDAQGEKKGEETASTDRQRARTVEGLSQICAGGGPKGKEQQEEKPWLGGGDGTRPRRYQKSYFRGGRKGKKERKEKRGGRHQLFKNIDED